MTNPTTNASGLGWCVGRRREPRLCPPPHPPPGRALCGLRPPSAPRRAPIDGPGKRRAPLRGATRRCTTRGGFIGAKPSLVAQGGEKLAQMEHIEQRTVGGSAPRSSLRSSPLRLRLGPPLRSGLAAPSAPLRDAPAPSACALRSGLGSRPEHRPARRTTASRANTVRALDPLRRGGATPPRHSGAVAFVEIPPGTRPPRCNALARRGAGSALTPPAARDIRRSEIRTVLVAWEPHRSTQRLDTVPKGSKLVVHADRLVRHRSDLLDQTKRVRRVRGSKIRIGRRFMNRPSGDLIRSHAKNLPGLKSPGRHTPNLRRRSHHFVHAFNEDPLPTISNPVLHQKRGLGCPQRTPTMQRDSLDTHPIPKRFYQIPRFNAKTTP